MSAGLRGARATGGGNVAAVAAPVVRLRDVTKSYGVGAARTPVLRGVSFDVEAGEFLALVGQSGSGKSTLLNIIGGLDRADTGTVVIAGQNTQRLSDRELSRLRNERIGFVFQSFHLVPSLTASGNVAAALTFQGVYGAERAHRTGEALDRVGLAGRATHRPSQLSGGEQQRVAIARAIVNRPKILLADEPTGNLDRTTGERLHETLRQLVAGRGLTVVLVTHNEALARRAALAEALAQWPEHGEKILSEPPSSDADDGEDDGEGQERPPGPTGPAARPAGSSAGVVRRWADCGRCAGRSRDW